MPSGDLVILDSIDVQEIHQSFILTCQRCRFGDFLYQIFLQTD